jgi:hypothetical protein
MKITTAKIIKLNPCKNRLHNWLHHYEYRTFTVEKFVDLESISKQDKIWVLIRLLPKFLIEVFAIDCAVTASSAATESTAITSASYSAADAAVDAVADVTDVTAAVAAVDAAADAADITAAATASSYSGNTYCDIYIAARENECQRQIEVLLYLIQLENL